MNMMYFKLMKVFFKENLSFKRILGTDLKSSKTKAILIILAIIYGFGSILFTIGLMFFQLGKVLTDAGMGDLLLNFIFIYATGLSIMFVLFRANGYIFHYKDYDILEPLPIKGRTVILAKMTVMMSFIYLTIFTVSAPIAFSYFYHGGFDVIKLLMMIVLLLFIPFIPLVLFSFVSLLIANFSTRFRFGKALNIILMFVFFLGIMFLSFSMNFSNGNPVEGQLGFIEGATKYLITGKWFRLAVDDLNILAAFGMIGLSGALLAGFIYLIQGLVKNTNQRSVVTRTSNKKKVTSKQRSILMNIISKETKKFFGVTIYVFNNGFGVIMMALAGIAVVIFKDNLNAFLGEFVALGIDIEVVLLLLLGFLISTVFTSAISLSLEGKNFWVLKSLPIKASTVMFGKMLFNVILTLPVALFAIFMSGYALALNVFNVLIMMVFIASLCFLSSGLGSIINLHFPKFNFVSETEVVKQSIGAFLGMLSSWLILTINGFIYYYLFGVFSFFVLVLLLSILNILLFVGVFYYIKVRSEVIFSKL